MKITKVNVDTLKSPEKNVRKHNEKQIRELARSIEKFGQIRPVVIDENFVMSCYEIRATSSPPRASRKLSRLTGGNS